MIYNLNIRQELGLVYKLCDRARQALRIEGTTITTKENFCKYVKLSAMKRQQIYKEPYVGPQTQLIALSRFLSWHYHSAVVAADGAVAVVAVEYECFVEMQEADAVVGTSQG